MAHLLLSGWMDGWIPRERGCPLATGVDIGEAKNRLKEVKRRKKKVDREHVLQTSNEISFLCSW